jgi:hypothetical protein
MIKTRISTVSILPASSGNYGIGGEIQMAFGKFPESHWQKIFAAIMMQAKSEPIPQHDQTFQPSR